MPSPLFADRSLAPGGHARVVKPDRPDIILAVVPALFALVRMRGREPFAAEIERLAVGRQSSLGVAPSFRAHVRRQPLLAAAFLAGAFFPALFFTGDFLARPFFFAGPLAARSSINWPLPLGSARRARGSSAGSRWSCRR